MTSIVIMEWLFIVTAWIVPGATTKTANSPVEVPGTSRPGKCSNIPLGLRVYLRVYAGDQGGTELDICGW